MMHDLNVVAVSSGVGYPSSTRNLSDLLLQSAREEAEQDGAEVAARTIEVRDVAADVVEATILGLPGDGLQEALTAVEGADLVVATSPVFRGSYAGIFKSFFDLVDPVAMHGKPVLLGATGGSQRHQLMIDTAMRPLFTYFGSLVVPTAVYAVPEDFGAAGIPEPPLQRRIARAGAQAAGLTTTAQPAPARNVTTESVQV